MRLSAPREQLLPVLQQVVGVVERRQTLPILGHVLVDAGQSVLTVTATDLEVELQSSAEIDSEVEGRLTLPARKLLDIVRSLPEGVLVTLSHQDGLAQLRSGRSRYSLSPLAADVFPALEEIAFDSEVRLPSGALHELLSRTHFAMAQQDVRYYLNGLLLETSSQGISGVATDGHRLALCDIPLAGAESLSSQVIVPRKGVQELLRVLSDSDDDVLVQLASNHLRVTASGLRFTCRLIDGRFPDYRRVVPDENEYPVTVDRQLLRDALARAAILSNEKHRGVRLRIAPGLLAALTHNPENEAAEEELEVDYQGKELEMGFNVAYLLDALGAIDGDVVHLHFFDSNSSCLVSDAQDKRCHYVIMPMRM